MGCLTLNVDLSAGVTIQTACKDAIILASKIGVKVKFEFNGKIVYALPYNDVGSLVMAYREAVKNNSDFVCSFEK